MRVLYISEVQWLSQVSRKHLLIRRFPADWDVLFLSPANAAARENSFRMRRDPTYGNVRFATLLLPKPDSRLAVVRALTGALARHGDRSLRALVGEFRPSVVVCSYLWAAPSVPPIRSAGIPVVYDLNDLHPEFYPNCRDRADDLFRLLTTSADEVVASSAFLREAAGRGTVIGNGVDLDTFTGAAPGALPEAVAASPLAECETFVAYVGSIDDRMDFGMLEATIARLARLPVASGLLVIGRVFDSARGRAESLAKEYPKHVLFTGRMAYEDLPGYLAHASVGVAPFVISPRTAAINPNKLYMYAAMNLNIVSTPFSQEVREQGDLIRLAVAPDEFASGVEDALGDDDRRRAVRERLAIPNSWDERASEFTSLLAKIARA